MIREVWLICWQTHLENLGNFLGRSYLASHGGWLPSWRSSSNVHILFRLEENLSGQPDYKHWSIRMGSHHMIIPISSPCFLQMASRFLETSMCPGGILSSSEKAITTDELKLKARSIHESNAFAC
ncbi:hypothetical protein AVEN_144662-1 [Araneus ventricosus]|uniref:Uncharacterized protein n=1 Tax=Araneus ventricosus TaxID=182803 RepID=A0A4Y2DZX1_ARAVE|nr:hypothetical protein AVEN_144662-1 [Araneus ventricosus]